MPRLLRAEEISRAAYLKIAHGDLKSRAEFCKLAYRAEALFRDLREHLILTEGEIGRRPACASPDAASYLVELGKAHFVRVLDYQRIDVGDVDACLDYRRAHKHLYAALGDVLHDGGELILIHPAVGHTHRNLVVEKLAQPYRGALNIVDAVVQVIHLPAALYLAPYRVGDDAPVVLHDEGLHGEPILRRLVDGRHIADARQRHIQRARYRRCRERQHVHAAAELLYVLLVADAEALLLVDDEQAEIFELNILLQKPVGADDKIAPAGFKILQRL